LSGRGLCDELITRPEESYRLCCVVVCDLETSRMGAPYIYDISRLRVKVCKSVHHHTIQINYEPYATISPVYYPDVYSQLNMFRASSRPSSGAQQLQQQPLVYRWNVVVAVLLVVVRHCYHHAPKVKPEAATAVVELLMMDVRTPETC